MSCMLLSFVLAAALSDDGRVGLPSGPRTLSPGTRRDPARSPGPRLWQRRSRSTELMHWRDSSSATGRAASRSPSLSICDLLSDRGTPSPLLHQRLQLADPPGDVVALMVRKLLREQARARCTPAPRPGSAARSPAGTRAGRSPSRSPVTSCGVTWSRPSASARNLDRTITASMSAPEKVCERSGSSRREGAQLHLHPGLLADHLEQARPAPRSGLRIEERHVLLRPPLPLEVDGEQVRPAGEAGTR